MVPALVDKAILAFVRRVAPDLSSVYLPSMGQIIEMPGESSSVHHDVYIRKIYEPIFPIPPRARIIDLGAHLGFFSIYAAGLSDGASIIAVEANPKTVPLLRTNLSRLKGCTSIDVRQAAIAAEPGKLSFLIHGGKAANVAGTLSRNTEKYSNLDQFITVEVEALPLDELLSQPVDFLKCDVEGSEYAVLTPQLFRPALIRQAAVEFHDILLRAEEFTALIGGALERGYSVFTSANVPLPDLQALARHTAGTHGAVQLKFASNS